jgi:hypothetical protein
MILFAFLRMRLAYPRDPLEDMRPSEKPLHDEPAAAD